MRVLRDIWEETSHRLDLLQANPECVKQEKKVIYDRQGPVYSLSFNVAPTPDRIMSMGNKPLAAIIREEGSNSDREMAAAFYSAGFDPWDVTMSDLLSGRITLDRFRGVALVGGFSYADVMDSAKGWAGAIRFNKNLSEQFETFYQRPDTFSLGVCNGCQLMALLGWIPWRGIADEMQPRFVHNLSGRFESRFVTARIGKSPAIMLRGMEESVLGVWVSHGEGQAHFPDNAVFDEVISKGLAPVRYADDSGTATEVYPFNPNGSPKGIAALCSSDGRHFAIMPHPERTFLKWNWAWMPEAMKQDLEVSPWLRMFQNAREWCERG
jgi:phosphoribosylformylglycinamidine synthase